MKPVLPLLLILSLGACGLPQFGPTHARMVSARAARQGDFTLIEGPDYIHSRNAAPKPGGFPAEFTGGRVFNTDIVSAGDQFILTIYENVPDGVFASEGRRISAVNDLQVQQSGDIYIPYAGALHVAGRSVERVRQDIVKALEEQTPDPQVTLSRVPGAGASVTLLGAISRQGVFPIEVRTTRLAEMIAAAGGPTEKLEEILVKVERNGRQGSARLSYIVDDPRQDIALRPGDRITLEQDSQSITVLGAAGSQSRVPVARHDFRLIELLGDVGGLNGASANPRGVFVYRNESQDGVTLREVIRFNLATPAGVFAARAFYMHDGDTVYVSEAPIRNVQKVFSALTGISESAQSAAAIGGQ